MAAQMLGSSTTTRTMPRVNLLPPEIAEQAALRRSQLAMVGVGLAAVAVVGVMYTNANGKVAEANEAKSQAAAESVTLETQLRGLQNVRDVYARIDASKQTLASAMKNEVLWSSYLHDMTLTIPDNVWLTNFTAAVTPSAGVGPGAVAASPAGGAVLDPGLGTVTIAGTAFEHADVATWLESLAKQKGYMNPYFSQAAKTKIGGRDVVNFTSTVNLTPAALSGRYTKGTPR